MISVGPDKNMINNSIAGFRSNHLVCRLNHAGISGLNLNTNSIKISNPLPRFSLMIQFAVHLETP